MKYELSKWDIDIISNALKNRIDYLEGMIMIHERFNTKDPEQITLLKVMLRETKRVQDLTTYDGKSIFLKDQGGFVDLDELAKLFQWKAEKRKRDQGGFVNLDAPIRLPWRRTV